MTTTSASFIKKLLILFLLIAGLYFAKDFLMPLAIAGLLATLFLPMCKWLEGHKIPKGLAAFACLLSLLVAMAGVGALLGWQVSELASDAGMIKQRITEMVNNTQQYIFTHLGIPAEKQNEMIKNQQPSASGFLGGVLGATGYIFTAFILMLVYMLLLLYYRVHIKSFLLKLATPAQRPEMEEVIFGAAKVSQQYLLGLTKMIVCLWIMYGIGFTIVGVKNAFFFAILCGLLEIIPFVGNITGTTLTVLVSVVNGASPAMVGGIVLTYGTVQFIQGWVLEPIIVGPQVKINPLATIVALVVGELLWGIPGIILAIPLVAMFKIVCDHVTPLKPYGFLIGEIDDGKKRVSLIEKVKTWFSKKFKK